MTDSGATPRAKFRSRPPGVPFTLACGIAGVLSILAGIPHDDEDRVLMLVLVWLVLGAVWIARISMSPTPERGESYFVWRWLAGPAIGALSVLLAYSPIPVNVAFALNRGALEEFVADRSRWVDWSDDRDETARVGVFRVENVEAGTEGTSVRVRGSGWGWGFIRTEAGGHPVERECMGDSDSVERYRRLDQQWYHWWTVSCP